MDGSIDALIGLAASTIGVLHPALSIVKQMGDTYSRVKFARARCKAVIRRAALIIKGVHDSAQKTGMDIPSSNVKVLETKLEEVQRVIHKLAEMSFLKALLRFDAINLEIEMADRHLTDCLQIFQIELLLRARVEKDDAAKSDRAVLKDILNKFTGNYEEIRRRFGIRTNDEEDQAMAAMERKLSQIDNRLEEETETRIIKSSLECIRSSTGKNSPKLNRWLITELDLDFGGTIGGGSFSTVRKAKFQCTTVAVKTLKDVGNLRKLLETEIDIWSQLRHDHIVPFYGASTISSPPYIVSRYMRKGNLVQYLCRRPNADRTKLIYEISLGMLYLHSAKIVHGDLKGVNVLVDDAGKACITDFGLSSFCSPTAAGAITDKISGTLRFLAPEALKGQPLNSATDVYAFGMVMYEVFAGEGPFVGVPDDRVREGNLTLTRPSSSRDSARDLTDIIWQLLLECTSRAPSERPPFATIQRRLELTRKEGPLPHTSSLGMTVRPGRLLHRTIALFPKDGHQTNWAYNAVISTSGSRTIRNTEGPSPKRDLPSDKPSSTSEPIPSFAYDIENVRPVCAEVTCAYFDVEFGLMKSREPGVYLEENDVLQWHPVGTKRGSLLRESANRFTYRQSIGEGVNTWELDGNKVRLHSFSIEAVCILRDTHAARDWFHLQLSYARNGFVGVWGSSNVKGDLVTTTRGWRRVVGGNLQQAAPVEETPCLAPSSWSSWSKIDLPKRHTVDHSDRRSNSITCIVNPGTSRAGKLCCSIRGRGIVFATYRRSVDQLPILLKEDKYPSEIEAQLMFDVVKAILGKGLDKQQKRLVSRGFF